MAAAPALIDAHGRTIEYLRISVTDRCDLRCRYCMSEHMRFLPRDALLRLDELALVADRFVARGVRKIRLTGGEPLVRGDTMELVRRIARHLGAGLDEITLTTNGTRLAEHAEALREAGMRRINVSLDSRDPAVFRHITRHGDLSKVLAGIAAAQAAGLAVKLNMVALKGLNEDEIPAMLDWAAARGMDLTLIETMPLGEVDEDRVDRFLPLTGDDNVSTALSYTFDDGPEADYADALVASWMVLPEGGAGPEDLTADCLIHIFDSVESAEGFYDTWTADYGADSYPTPEEADVAAGAPGEDPHAYTTLVGDRPNTTQIFRYENAVVSVGISGTPDNQFDTLLEATNELAQTIAGRLEAAA